MTMQSNQNPRPGYFQSVGGQLTALGIAVVVLVLLALFAF
jgi:hypothetical protein